MARSFGDWMEEVDAALERLSGMSSGDLPDWPYRDAYDDGLNPISVAREVLSES